jgi:hypothetical protein
MARPFSWPGSNLALVRPGEAAATLARSGAPKRLPPEPPATLGANAVLRWKERHYGANAPSAAI